MKRIITSKRHGASEVAVVTKAPLPVGREGHRYNAECLGSIAQGDTIEEACDNVRDAVFGPGPAYL